MSLHAIDSPIEERTIYYWADDVFDGHTREVVYCISKYRSDQEILRVECERRVGDKKKPYDLQDLAMELEEYRRLDFCLRNEVHPDVDTCDGPRPSFYELFAIIDGKTLRRRPLDGRELLALRQYRQVS